MNYKINTDSNKEIKFFIEKGYLHLTYNDNIIHIKAKTIDDLKNKLIASLENLSNRFETKKIDKITYDLFSTHYLKMICHLDHGLVLPPRHYDILAKDERSILNRIFRSNSRMIA